jgi:hypothetical protein
MARPPLQPPAGQMATNGAQRNGIVNETFKGIEKLESSLWEAADNLRANS